MEIAEDTSPLLTAVVWCILVTETGERFAYYGFRAVLVLYFTMELEYEENLAIAFFAYTTALAYLSPILGAVLSDGHWGRYYTILFFGILYVIGLAILTLAAAFDWSLLTERLWTMIGLLLVCIGTGGIKPCVSAFGADQVEAMVTLKQPPLLEESSSASTDTSDFVMMDQCQCGVMEQLGVPLEETELDPQEAIKQEQVRTFFGYFYLSINIGAVASIALVPIIRGRYGFGAAFLLPTIFMVTAMLLFVSMSHKYVCHVPGEDGSSLSTTFILCGWLLRNEIWNSVPWVRQYAPRLRPGPMPFVRDQRQPLVEQIPDQNSVEESSADSINNNNRLIEQQLEDAAQALHVLPIMAMLPIFWCLYDQQGSVWTLQATRMGLNGLQPEQLNIVNPVQILVFVPLFDRCIYPWMQKHRLNIRPIRRMAYGMFLAAAAFFISGSIESTIEYRESNNLPSVSVFWQLPQITLMSIAEIFVSVTGLEFAYATSPERLKAFIMALFLLTTAFGNSISGIMYSTVFATMDRALVMHICGILMVMNLVLFCRVSRWWEERTNLQRTTSSFTKDLELPDRRIV